VRLGVKLADNRSVHRSPPVIPTFASTLGAPTFSSSIRTSGAASRATLPVPRATSSTRSPGAGCTRRGFTCPRPTNRRNEEPLACFSRVTGCRLCLSAYLQTDAAALATLAVSQVAGVPRAAPGRSSRPSTRCSG
jgi:hypothetical protein